MTERKILQEDFEALKARRLAEDPRYGTIASRLRELFWDRSCNDITLRFYNRLQDEAIFHGEPVYRSIKSCASAAQSAKCPVRYFASAVTKRLREQGYMQRHDDSTGL